MLLLLLEFQSVNTQMSLDVVPVIFSYKVRANYHEISERYPNFCIPLYVLLIIWSNYTLLRSQKTGLYAIM